MAIRRTRNWRSAWRSTRRISAKRWKWISQGRLVIPAALRKTLGIEDQTVRLRVFRGYIEILSERMYQELLKVSSGAA